MPARSDPLGPVSRSPGSSRPRVDLVFPQLAHQRRPRDPEQLARLPTVPASPRDGAPYVLALDLVERREARDALGRGLGARRAGVGSVDLAELEVLARDHGAARL